ncbi:MAG: hypothetical protein U0Q16_32275 [Bryobacteraceae bacterium]
MVVVVDNGDAESVEPADAAKDVALHVRVFSEVNRRLERMPEDGEIHRMPKCPEDTCCRRYGHANASLQVNEQKIGETPLENAVRGSGVNRSEHIHWFSSASKLDRY